MKYVAATLVGGHKLYSKDKFWKGIDFLNQQPERFFVSTTEAIFEAFADDVNKREWIHGPEDLGDDMVHSTTSAREAIRVAMLQYMEEAGVEWGLWLDNDIGVPSDLIERAEKLITQRPNLVLINSYHPARQREETLRHGMACTFTHRDALAAFPFVRAQLRGSNYGDDQIWLNTITRFRGWAKGVDVASGIFFDVIHFVEDGSERALTGELRGELI